MGNYTFTSAVVLRTTITTVSGLSTAILSNPAWTGNTAITSTIIDGSSTVTATLPVLYGCSLCGEDNHGLVIWGLPADTGKSKVIYDLPGLPPFTIGPSGQPVPKLASTSFVFLSSSHTANTVLPSISSVLSQSMVASSLPSTAAASRLTHLLSMTPLSSLISSSSSQAPSNTPSASESAQDLWSISSDHSRNYTTLRVTTFVTNHHGVLLVRVVRKDKVPAGRSQRIEPRLLPQHLSVPTIT